MLIERPHLQATNCANLRLERQDSSKGSAWVHPRNHRFKTGAKIKDKDKQKTRHLSSFDGREITFLGKGICISFQFVTNFVA